MSHEQCNRRWLKKKKGGSETHFDTKRGRINRYPNGTVVCIYIHFFFAFHFNQDSCFKIIDVIRGDKLPIELRGYSVEK